eukprot:9941490-Prorocentrum_lima.AAC.1
MVRLGLSCESCCRTAGSRARNRVPLGLIHVRRQRTGGGALPGCFGSTAMEVETDASGSAWDNSSVD